MCVPALDALAQRFALTLIGKPWAKDLFAAYPWPVVPLAGSWWSQLSTIRTQAPRGDAALLFTNSLGSALHMRLAGLRARGYATDGRGLLLTQALPRPARWATDMHTVEYYFELAHRAFGLDLPPVPENLRLRISDAARARAGALLATAAVSSAHVVLCPVAVGKHRGQVKAWTEFDRLCRALQARDMRVVAMPGPGEYEAVRAAVPGATLLPPSDVGTFAALLEASRLVVANDSGPGHIAAAVGAPLVSVFGVTDPLKTRPWGPRVHVVGSGAGWPSYEAVESAVLAALA